MKAKKRKNAALSDAFSALLPPILHDHPPAPQDFHTVWRMELQIEDLRREKKMLEDRYPIVCEVLAAMERIYKGSDEDQATT